MGASLSACTCEKSSNSSVKNTRSSLKPGKTPVTIKRHQPKKPDQESQVLIWSTPERSEEKQYYSTVLHQNRAIDHTAIHNRLDKNTTRHDRDGQVEKELTAVQQEAEHYLTWLYQCGKMVRGWNLLKLSRSEVLLRLEDLQKLETDLMLKQDDLNTISNKVKGLATEHLCIDEVNIEKSLAKAWTQYTKLLNTVSERCHALENLALEHKNFDKRLQKLKKYFKGNMNAADCFDSIRLSACEVDQQLDSCKSMSAEIQSQAQEVDQIRMMADSLKQTCNNCGKQELDTAVWELTKQHEQLMQRLKQQQDNLWNLASSRRKFERDCHKIDQWCKDTTIICSRGLPLKCTAEVLEQQYKIFKNLSNSAHVFHSLFEETKGLAESYFPSLLLAEQPLLTRQIGSLHYKFIRVSRQVHKQLQTLEDALENRSGTHEQITLCGQWLYPDIKHPSRSETTHSMNIHQNTHEKTFYTKSEQTASQVSIVKLNRVYESSITMVQIEGVKQTGATTETTEGIDVEYANKKMEDFEKEVNELMKWVEHIRTRMTTRDTTLDLHRQLVVQQVSCVCQMLSLFQ